MKRVLLGCVPIVVVFFLLFAQSTIIRAYNYFARRESVRTNLTHTNILLAGSEPVGHLNEKYFEQLHLRLEQLISQNQGTIGISYIDMTTGETVSINGSQMFLGASTNKVPMAMRIADLVYEGKLSWEQKITYEQSDFEGGTGVLQGRIHVGDEFTIAQLLRYSIVYSDNIAKNMLFRMIAPSANEVIQNFYDTYLPEKQHKAIGNHFSSDVLARFLKVLYKGRGKNPGYQTIYEYMQQTIFQDRLMTPQTKGYVAHKIGQNGSYVHDMGLFSGEYPYVLVVMTNGTPHAKELISEISNLVWSMQHADYLEPL